MAFTLVAAPVFSKANPTVTGKVIEKENGNPLGFATVSLHSAQNRVVGGTTTLDDGTFQIERLEAGKYNLKVSFIGFRDTLLSVDIKDGAETVNLGVLKLSSDAVALKSAVISAKVPVIEQKLDKIVMNVSEAVSTEGSNALDILRKAPGISVDPSGNILLNGRPVQVWIDGRPSNLSGTDLESFLNGTDGSTIDKLEIIAHPSSRYDAAGSGGIINIKTRRNFAKGISGSLRGSYNAAPKNKLYHGADGTLTLGYRSEKSNTTISYSPRYADGFNYFKTKTWMENGNTLESNSFLNRYNKNHGLRVASDFFINKNNIVGFILNGVTSKSADSSDADTGSRLFSGSELIEKTGTSINNKFSYGNLSANLNYTHIFREGTELTLNGDYYYYDMNRKTGQENYFSDITGAETRSPYIFRSNSDQYVNIYSIKADFETPVWKKGKLESGLKWASSRTDNLLLREDKVNGAWVENEFLSSVFDYNENIAAGYVSLSYQPSEKWTLKGGLRGELTMARGEWISADTLTSKNYLDIFPTLFIGFNPNKQTRIGLSYTKRIQRPNFEQLNPHRFYIDASSSSVGNPDILPEYSQNINLSLGIGKYLNFGARADIIRKAIVQSPEIEEETGEKVFLWENFGKQNMFGATVSLTEFPVAKWLIVNGNIYLACMSTKNPGYSKNSVFLNGNINTTILLPADFKFEVSGWYQSGLPYGYLDVKPRGELSMGIKKSLFENKGTISLFANDILFTHNSRISIKDRVLSGYEFESHWRSRRITLTFTYRFGQSKGFKARKVGGSDEARRVSTGN
jgi:hypothetical protein